MCVCVCLSMRDMADRTQMIQVKIFNRDECKFLSLGTASLFYKNRMGTLGQKNIKLGVSPDSDLKLSHQCGKASRKAHHRAASTEGQCLEPER